MERLTHERANGIKTGYWSAATKEVLVQKLAAYENTGYEPDEIRAAIEMERRAGSGPLGFPERSNDGRKTNLPLVQLYAGNEIRKNDREQQPPERPARGLYV